MPVGTRWSLLAVGTSDLGRLIASKVVSKVLPPGVGSTNRLGAMGFFPLPLEGSASSCWTPDHLQCFMLRRSPEFLERINLLDSLIGKSLGGVLHCEGSDAYWRELLAGVSPLQSTPPLSKGPLNQFPSSAIVDQAS